MPQQPLPAMFEARKFLYLVFLEFLHRPSWWFFGWTWNLEETNRILERCKRDATTSTDV